MTERKPSYILTLSCPDGVGIVAAVTANLAHQGALITEAHHYREPMSNSSILRPVFEAGGIAPLNIERVMRDFEAVAGRFGMTCKIRDPAVRQRVLVAVSKQGHCLNSLLHRWEVDTLPVDIVGVVSNGRVVWVAVPLFANRARRESRAGTPPANLVS